MNKRISQWALGALFISIFIFIWSLWHRAIHIDDVWLAEYSYWLERLGYVKSEAMRGFSDAEHRLYIYHKLLAIEGAALIRFFGFSPYVLKSLALVFLAGCLCVVHFLFQKHSKAKESPYLLFALFLSFFHTVNLSFMFRPELHLVFWGLCSFVFLEKFLDDENKKYALVFAGILSGIGTATHLNGVVFTAATVAFLWIYRRWWAGFIFGAIASWGLFFFFLFDAHTWVDLQHSFYQLTHWRDVATGKYGWEILFRVFTEQARFLHSPPEIFYSFLLVFLLVPARKTLWQEQRRLVVYAALLFFFIAEITHGTNTNYLMYTFPFFILLSTHAFGILLRQGKRKWALSAVAIYFVGSWAYNIGEFSNRETMAPEYAKIASFLPEGAQVLAPAHLMFPGLGKMHIQSFIIYRDKIEAGTMTATPESLVEEASRFDIEFIVFDQSNKDFFKIESDSYGRYRSMAEQPSKKFRIFKRSGEQSH